MVSKKFIGAALVFGSLVACSSAPETETDRVSPPLGSPDETHEEARCLTCPPPAPPPASAEARAETCATAVIVRARGRLRWPERLLVRGLGVRRCQRKRRRLRMVRLPR